MTSPQGGQRVPQVPPQPSTASQTLFRLPTCLHHHVQLRPPRLHVSCPHAYDGWLLVSSRKLVVSAEQLASHDGQPAPASLQMCCRVKKSLPATSLRSSWLDPNLGEMQAVLMETGEIVAHYFLLQCPSNITRISSKYQTHLPDSYTRKGLNSKVANLWVTQRYLW